MSQTSVVIPPQAPCPMPIAGIDSSAFFLLRAQTNVFLFTHCDPQRLRRFEFFVAASPNDRHTLDTNPVIVMQNANVRSNNLKNYSLHQL